MGFAMKPSDGRPTESGDPMTFGEKVRKRIEELRVSQEELAEKVGTSQSQVSSWLTKGVVPSTPYALRVSKYLELPIDYLIDDDIDTPATKLTESEQLLIEIGREYGPINILKQLMNLVAKGAVILDDQSNREIGDRETGRIVARFQDAVATSEQLDRMESDARNDLARAENELSRLETERVSIERNISMHRLEMVRCRDQIDDIRQQRQRNDAETEYLRLLMKRHGIDPRASQGREPSQAAARRSIEGRPKPKPKSE